MNKKVINSKQTINSNLEENIVYYTTNDGVKIVAEETSDFLPFSLSFSILSGSRDEFEQSNGTAHFLEHILFRRTKRLKSKQIAKEFEKFGAIANAFTTKEYTSYFVTANFKNFQKVTNLLYEVVFQPEFNEQDLEKERKIIFDEIKSSDEEPEEILNDKLAEIQFENNLISLPIAGTLDSVSKITINDIESFFNNYYISENLIVSYAGPNIDEFFKIIESLKFASKKFNKPAQTLKFQNQSEIEVKTNISSQIHLSMTYLTKQCDMKTRMNFALLNIMLTEAMSSRLYQILREKNGLTYNIYSGFTNYLDFTELNFFTSFDPKYRNKVYKLIEIEFQKIKEKAFTKNEVNIAKELLKTYSLIENEGSLNKINNLTRQVMLYGKVENSKELISGISSITLDYANSMNKDIFDLSKWYKCYLIPD